MCAIPVFYTVATHTPNYKRLLDLPPFLNGLQVGIFLPHGDLWCFRFGEHRGLRKQILGSSRLKDTIRVIDSEGYCLDDGPKDSLDQDSG